MFWLLVGACIVGGFLSEKDQRQQSFLWGAAGGLLVAAAIFNR